MGPFSIKLPTFLFSMLCATVGTLGLFFLTEMIASDPSAADFWKRFGAILGVQVLAQVLAVILTWLCSHAYDSEYNATIRANLIENNNQLLFSRKMTLIVFHSIVATLLSATGVRLFVVIAWGATH